MIRRHRIMSRTAAVIQTTLIITSVIAILSSSIVFADSNDTITIDSDTIWENDESITGLISIVDGGSLTINNAEITMMAGSSIEIAEGSSLRLDSSILNANSPPTSLISSTYWDEENRSRILIPRGGYNESFDATLFPAYGLSFDGAHAHIEGSEPIEMNGGEYTLSFPAGTEDIWVGLTAFGFAPVTLSKIQTMMSTGTLIDELLGIELEYHNMMIEGEAGFTIDSSGNIELISSTMQGGKINSDGSITIDDSAIENSAPIFLESNTAEIDIRGFSILSGSHDDHYVRAFPESVIQWGDNVETSVEIIDRWERRISGQSIQFDAIGVFYSVLGESPSGDLEFNNVSGDDGVSYIVGGEERVIEIGWADGSITNENANIIITSYRTAWNPETLENDIGNYGPQMIPLTWEKQIVIDSNIPNIQWESLAMTDEVTESSTVHSVPILARLANRGTAPANFFFTCDITETGEAADIGGYQNAVIDAGESLEISFGWRNANQGNASLTCRILTPTQLVEDDAFGGGLRTTGVITWIQPIEEESMSIIPILIAIALTMIGAGYYYFNNFVKQKDDEEDFIDDDYEYDKGE
tara:strand:+ start:1103 stop:2857 length:1755 start_codon:yes stop_codon:yes gene_type:complete